MDTCQNAWFKFIFLFLFIFNQGHSLPIGEQAVLSIGYPSVSHRRDGFVLPVFDANASARYEEIRLNREGYQYGPPLLGNTSYFPTGVLGDALVQRDKALWFQDVQYISDNVNNIEIPQAAKALADAGGLQNLSSYRIIYENQFQHTIPDGPSPGILTNWTQDLLFSMSRLSINPFVIRRLHPQNDQLPFQVSPEITRQLTSGLSLHELHTTGRLFYANHSIQAKYPINANRYAGACTAYFYIHPLTQKFLPLAIMTSPSSPLIYTPLDSPNSWLLAKMAFEMNDLFHGQIYHLSNTHDVAEPIYLAALRTLSIKHPVRGVLDRLLYRAFAVRPVGDEVLFNEGGFFDASFAATGVGGRMFSSDLYPVGAGLFRGSGFTQDLVSRGLLNCSYGPALLHMPFYETVNPMVEAIRSFMEIYIDSFYPSNELMIRDHELQSWVLECIEEAKVLDFPPFPLTQKDILVEILTHIAYLTGIAHHVLNGATPGESSGILPLHPSAFHLPLPTKKTHLSEGDLMQYLHNETEALKQASLLVRFNRPAIAEQEASLVHMFFGEDFLGRVGGGVRRAERRFREVMVGIGEGIGGRVWDGEGLVGGMPFIWRSLDPRRIPFYLSV